MITPKFKYSMRRPRAGDLSFDREEINSGHFYKKNAFIMIKEPGYYFFNFNFWVAETGSTTVASIKRNNVEACKA